MQNINSTESNNIGHQSGVYNFYRGRWALSFLLKALSIGRDDKVILQGFTCEAVPIAVHHSGAQPIFIDTKKHSVNMCPLKLRNCLETTPNAKLVVVQYTFGSSEDIEEIFSICNDYGVFVVEDCCHLPFPFGKDISPKNMYHLGRFYSLEWGKPIPVGIGGILQIFSQTLKKECDDLYLNYTPVPRRKRAIIQMQFLVFNFLYTPRLRKILRTCFRIFGKLGVVESNKTTFKSGTYIPESTWKMAPGVFKRFNSLKSVERAERCTTEYKEASKIAKKLDFFQLSTTSEYLMRHPILVKDKTSFIKAAESMYLEVGEWYSSVVDPLTEEECRQNNWEIKHCENAEFLSKHVATLTSLDVVKLSRNKLQLEKLLRAGK